MHPQLLPRVAAYRQDDLVAEAHRARGDRTLDAAAPRRRFLAGLRVAVGTQLIEVGWRLVQTTRTGA